MTNALVFISFIVLALIFAVIVAVITLRFLTVMAEMRQQETHNMAVLLKDVDQSHVQAFSNAMTAFETVQSRVRAEGMAMFKETMDMVHGPAQATDPATTYTVDHPGLDMRPAWMPDDDGDGIEQMIDPTDEDAWLKLGGDVMHGDEDGRAVSVRPGETLVPGP